MFNARSDLPASAAAAVEPAQEPSPPPSGDDSSVSASPSPPDSPRIICSQYRQAQHDEATTALPAGEEPPTIISYQETVFDRRMRIESGQEMIFKRDSDLQVYVRADHRNPEGQAPRCYVATGAELLRSARRVAQQQGRGRQRPPPGGSNYAYITQQLRK